jgi:hypothetical protein
MIEVFCRVEKSMAIRRAVSKVTKLGLLGMRVILCLILLDLSTARIQYHYMLSLSISPLKRDIIGDIYNYHDSVPIELRECRAFDRQSGTFIRNCSLSACEQNAYQLSERRQYILETVRSHHPASRIVGEIFDVARGVDQKEKIENLFSRKSCEGVINSSDKTNIFMDIVAALTFIFGVYTLFGMLLRHFFRVKVD